MQETLERHQTATGTRGKQSIIKHARPTPSLTTHTLQTTHLPTSIYLPLVWSAVAWPGSPLSLSGWAPLPLAGVD